MKTAQSIWALKHIYPFHLNVAVLDPNPRIRTCKGRGYVGSYKCGPIRNPSQWEPLRIQILERNSNGGHREREADGGVHHRRFDSSFELSVPNSYICRQCFQMNDQEYHSEVDPNSHLIKTCFSPSNRLEMSL